jgi:integrase
MKRKANKIKLNQMILKNLKPRAAGAFLTWDTLQHGLVIQMQPSGVASWKVIYSRHSKPRWYHIGRADAIGLADARKQAGKIMVQVAEGKDPAADRRAEHGSGTFAELADRYRDEYAKKNNKSWQQADNLVKKHLLPKWGKLKTTDIDISDVEKMMARITAPIVANQTLAAASAIFAWAIKKRVVKINPCIGVDRNATKERERILSNAELPIFWKAFDDSGPVRSAALKVLLLCGQRPGEVAHMRTEHLVDGSWWEMPGEPVPELDWPGTKNGESHRVWLPKAARDIIAEMDADGFVFAGPRGGPIIELDKAMREICEKLGVKDKVTPHDLRRTHGTTITGLGFGREALNRLQNHKEGGIADVYDRHDYADKNKQIMEAVAAELLRLIEGRPSGNVVVADFGARA